MVVSRRVQFLLIIGPLALLGIISLLLWVAWDLGLFLMMAVVCLLAVLLTVPGYLRGSRGRP